MCDGSMLIGRGRIEGLSLKATSVLLADRGPGEDDSLREGSTGGSGRLFGTK